MSLIYIDGLRRELRKVSGITEGLEGIGDAAKDIAENVNRGVSDYSAWAQEHPVRFAIQNPGFAFSYAMDHLNGLFDGEPSDNLLSLRAPGRYWYY